VVPGQDAAVARNGEVPQAHAVETVDKRATACSEKWL